MNRETFLDSFGHIADAPGGIDRLRGLILDLAVRGRLTERHDGDEPVDDLLVRIDRERDRKVAERMMRRPRARLNVSEGELRHLIPAEWKWVKVARIAQVVGGGTPTAGDASNFAEPGIPWITPADMEQGRIRRIERGERSLSEKGYSSCSASLMPAGSLVMSSRAPIGYVAVAANELCTNQGFKSLVPHAMECSAFLFWALRAYRSVIESLGSGTTFREVSGGVVEALSLPLPSVQEQHRIVERVDELMALCEELEQQQAARTEARSVLTAATLHRVVEADDAAALESAVVRFAERLDLQLSPGEGDIGALNQLRQAILDLAVHGRLTRRDSGDEPAKVVVARIVSDRTERGSSSRSRRSDSRSSLPLMPQPFELPESWTWARLGEISRSRLGKMLDEQKNTGNPRPYLRNTNVQWGRFKLDEIKRIRIEDEDLAEYTLQDGDLLVVEGGEPGRCAIWDSGLVDGVMVFQKALHRVRPEGGVSARYLAIVLRNGIDSGRLRELFTGSTIKHLTGEKIKSFPVPLPPVAEQHRIVERVEELLAFCDDLEQQFVSAEALRGDLAASITAHAIVDVA